MVLGMTALVPFFKAEFDLSPTTASLVVSAANFGAIISTVVMGAAIDGLGERVVVGATMVAMGATTMLVGILNPQYDHLLLLLVMIGIWYGAVQPGGTKAIVSWFSPNLRGLAMGIRQAALPLGGAAAAAVLPTVALAVGWRAAVWAQGLAGIVGGLSFWIVYRDDVARAVRVRNKPLSGAWKLIPVLLRQRHLRIVLAIGVPMVSVQFIVLAHLVMFMTTEMRIPLLTAEWMLAAIQIAGVVGRIALAAACDRLWPGRRIHSLLGMMMACSLALFALAVSPAELPLWIPALVCVCVGVVGMGWYTLFLVEVSERAPSSAVASAVGFALTLNQVAAVIAPPALGAIAEVSGSYRFGWAALAFLLVAAALCLFRAVQSADGESAPAVKCG